MKIENILLEKKKTRYSIMYHGTSDRFLKPILKQGLLANPPAHTYDYDSEHPDAVKTFGGVYVTPNLTYAKSIGNDAVVSHGGGRLIVTIQYPHGSADVDEDLIIDEFEKAMIEYHAILMDSAKRLNLEDWKTDDFLEQSIIDDFGNFARFLGKAMLDQLSNIGKLGRTVPSQILELAKFVQSFVMHEQSYIHQNRTIHNFMTQPREFLRQYSDFEKIIENIMGNVYPVTEKSAHALRLTRNVGYRGKTKILRIEGKRGETYYENPNFLEIYDRLKETRHAT